MRTIRDYLLDMKGYANRVAYATRDGKKAFEEKMARLTATLNEQFAESARLEAIIRQNLSKLGYDG